MSFSGQGSSPIPLGTPDSPGNALPPNTCVPFYCPVANYPTPRGLKQHLFVSSHSLGPSLGGLDWVFCPGSHKAKLKVLAGLGSCLEALGKTPPPNSFKVLAGSVPCSCWTEVPISILAFFVGGVTLRETFTDHFSRPPPPSKPATVSFLCFGSLQLSLLSPAR